MNIVLHITLIYKQAYKASYQTITELAVQMDEFCKQFIVEEVNPMLDRIEQQKKMWNKYVSLPCKARLSFFKETFANGDNTISLEMFSAALHFLLTGINTINPQSTINKILYNDTQESALTFHDNGALAKNWLHILDLDMKLCETTTVGEVRYHILKFFLSRPDDFDFTHYSFLIFNMEKLNGYGCYPKYKFGAEPLLFQIWRNATGPRGYYNAKIALGCLYNTYINDRNAQGEELGTYMKTCIDTMDNTIVFLDTNENIQAWAKDQYEEYIEIDSSPYINPFCEQKVQ